MMVEPGIVDTNVLVYALDAEASQYHASRTLVEEARHSTTTLYVTSQILCEFYSVVTNAKRVTTACSPSEALNAISALLAFPGIRVLPAPVSVVAGWMSLLGRHPVKGADVFELQLVATMKANNVQRIYTFNTNDFELFGELDVCTPVVQL